MRNEKKSVLVLAIAMAFAATALLLPGLVGAGELEPSEELGPTMHTLDEIYNKLDLIENKIDQLLSKQIGGEWITYHRDYDEDGYGDPNDTLEAWIQPEGYVEDNTDCDDTDVSINPGASEIPDNDVDDDCDGMTDEQMRFTDLGNGTVRDDNTGLIWLKNANCFGAMNWDDAMGKAAALYSGECGLTDGSSEGDWRLPTIDEWQAFVDTNYSNPALCNAAGSGKWSEGDAFSNVQSYNYWSSTTYPDLPDNAWRVYMNDGSVHYYSNDYGFYVWPVRANN